MARHRQGQLSLRWDEPPLKRCPKCGQVKTVMDFFKSSLSSDGVDYWCKACHAAKARTYAEEHREKQNEYAHAWALAHPERIKRTRKRHHEKHKAERNAASLKWYRDHEDRVRQTQQEYRSDPAHLDAERARKQRWQKERVMIVRAINHRYRARKKNAPSYPFTAEQLEQKLAYWGNRCWICGGTQEAIDHVKPLNKGGWHILANLRPICGPCNVRKKDKWPYLPRKEN